jgi:hypothetical protein
MDNMNVMTDEQLRKLIDGLADQDHALGELARLMTLSALYEDREEYEKCAILKKHIDKLNKIIDNI